ncbi:hypothetical protein AAC387_Pa02g1563 [Persea americana]
MRSNLSGPISKTIAEDRESDLEQAEGEQARGVEAGDPRKIRRNTVFNSAMDDKMLGFMMEQIDMGRRGEMLNASGFGYENNTHRIVVDDEVWIGWLRGHPKANTWRSRTIDYDKLYMVFGMDSATGRFARSSVDGTIPNVDADG